MPGPFVVNVAEAPALRHPHAGAYVPFDSREDRFPEFGINVHVLEPGEPASRYHAEEAQECFLVLGGECLLIMDGEERPLRVWDFVHCPAGTEHVFVGAGERPCAILMVGTRGAGRGVHYPVNEIAARYGASVAQPTDDPATAYADWRGGLTPTRLPWPPPP